MEYIITFLISMWFAYLANSPQYAKSRSAFYIFSFFSLLFPILLAGARSLSVGTDTYNYYLAFERAVNAKSFPALLREGSSLELGFQYFTYVCTRFTNNYFLLMSLFHAMIIIPVYVALVKWREQISPVYGLFIFYFMFFCMTLNTTRQAVAVSYSILSISYLFDRGGFNWKSLLFAFVAVSFHNSAYLLFVILCIFFMVHRYSLKEHLLVYVLSVLIFLSVLYVFFMFFDVVSLIEGEREVYSSYLNSDREGSISKSSLLFLCFVNYLLYRVFVREDNDIMNFFFLSSIFATLMVFLAIYNPTFRRLGLYFSILEIISVPLAMRSKDGNFRIIPKELGFVLVIIIMIMWYFSIVLRGSHEVYPYSSSLF